MADTWKIDFKDKTELNAIEKNTNNTSGDPRGEYPKPEYWYKPSVNNEIYQLSIGGGDPSIDISEIDTTTSTSSDYSEANVKVTKSGHALIFDDKGGEERIILKHRNGTGIEMKQDGSMIMRTETNMITSVGGTGVLIIDGDLKVSCKNVELDATGDMDVRVAGDYNLTVDGHKTETIKGSDRKVITGNSSTTVTGNVNSTTVGTVTNTILGNATNIIKGYYNNIIGGTYSMAVKGFSRFTSQTEIAISSGNINMAAADLSIFGAAGTIGGANVTYYAENYFGKSATFTEGITANGVTSTSGITANGVTSSTGMTAPTFTGSLTGIADFAIKASSQNYAENLIAPAGGATGDAAPYTNTNTATGATGATDTTATAQPTTAILTDYLSNSDRGIQKVIIDAGDHIRNKIDLTTKTGGISKRDLSVKEIRVKLKDDNNAANKEFLKYIYARSKVNQEYIKKVPSDVNRSYDGSIAYTPHKTASLLGENILIKSQKQPKDLLPDSSFNPMNIDPRSGVFSVNRKTLLGIGIPMSVFLVNGVTLGHLDAFEDRQALAKQLLLQAEVIKFHKNTPQFKDYRLVVAEGVYKAEAGETLKENSIPYLAQTGRAIVYELYDQYNQMSSEVTFDFATRLADSLFAYDKIILDYDTLESEFGKDLNSQIIVTMPEVDNEFKTIENAKMKYETRYNSKIMSNTDLVEIGSSAPPAAHKEPEVNDERLGYKVVGQIRDRRIKSELENALINAAITANIDFITITSGAQPGSTLKRIGSSRHDTGLAADFTLTKDGRLLSAANIQDQAIMSEFLKAAKANGVLAGGMSKKYMGNNTMHLDMLGAFKDGAYDKKTIVTWESDAWFTYAMKN
jgi:hypothetical protein